MAATPPAPVPAARAAPPAAPALPPDFAGLGIDRWLVDSLGALAIRRPTPIQAACIPPILEGI